MSRHGVVSENRNGSGQRQVQVGLSMIDVDLVEVKQRRNWNLMTVGRATYLFTMPAPVAASKTSVLLGRFNFRHAGEGERRQGQEQKQHARGRAGCESKSIAKPCLL
jgi:hypothetical protein